MIGAGALVETGGGTGGSRPMGIIRTLADFLALHRGVNDMARVKDELQRLADLEKQAFEIGGAVPPSFENHEFLWLATVYLKAAKVVHADDPSNWQPFVQLAGHATECALKCFLRVQGVKSHGHDLIKLLDLAEVQGFRLNDVGCRTVIALSRLYSKEPFASQSYLSRYPATNWLQKDLPVPGPHAVQQVVDAIFQSCQPP
jgi:hypothetical protein